MRGVESLLETCPGPNHPENAVELTADGPPAANISRSTAVNFTGNTVPAVQVDASSVFYAREDGELS